jgi:RimJ/RimL family protein N-acetyltransferase
VAARAEPPDFLGSHPGDDQGQHGLGAFIPYFIVAFIAHETDEGGLHIQLIIESKNPPAEGKGVRESDDAPDDDRFVGQVMLHSGVAKNRSADIGIAIEPRWWGQGIGTEAIKWIIDFGFEEYGLNRIGLECDGHNLRAVGAYKKA